MHGLVALWVLGMAWACSAQSTAVCNETYTGYPNTVCHPPETSCLVQCVDTLPAARFDCTQIETQDPCAPDLSAACQQVGSRFECINTLLRWPQGLPLFATKLTWRHDSDRGARIGVLDSSFFRPGSQLTELTLDSVSVTAVRKDAFKHLHHLKHIDIGSSSLRSFPFHAVVGAAQSNVDFLSFNSNLITSVDLSFILLQPSFRLLGLHVNRITVFVPLPEGAEHASLKTLNLRDNLLATPENMTRGLVALDSIFLGQNRFTHLPASTFDPRIRLRRLELLDSAVVHVPFGVITDVLRPSAPGAMGIELSMAGSPSVCTLQERVGNLSTSYLDISCDCDMHFRDEARVVRLTNATHCPLGRRIQCPLAPETEIRLDEFCDGVNNCGNQLDEECSQIGVLFDQSPPSCIHNLLGVANSNARLKFGITMAQGVLSGSILAGPLDDEAPVAFVHGTLHDIRQTADEIGTRVLGYFIDSPVNFNPVPFKYSMCVVLCGAKRLERTAIVVAPF